MSKERQDRYQSLCEEGAALLGVKPDAPIARRFATLTLGHEACGVRLINGSGNPDTLVKIEEQLAALMPAAEPLAVTVKIVNPSQTMCPQCSHVFSPDSPQRTVARQTPRTIDTEPVQAPEAKPAATVAAAKAIPAPKPEPPKPDYAPAIDFHKNAPLRNGAEPWRPYARQGTITDGGGTPYHVLDPKLPGS